MPSYVTLINWTEQGVRNYKDSISRYVAVASAAEGLGVRFTDIFWTIGPYDVVAVVEAPDDESLAAVLLTAAAQGNIRTTTMRAFRGDEMRDVIGKTG
jgi:uncharacterized protein with GYD domain